MFARDKIRNKSRETQHSQTRLNQTARQYIVPNLCFVAIPKIHLLFSSLTSYKDIRPLNTSSTVDRTL